MSSNDYEMSLNGPSLILVNMVAYLHQDARLKTNDFKQTKSRYINSLIASAKWIIA